MLGLDLPSLAIGFVAGCIVGPVAVYGLIVWLEDPNPPEGGGGSAE